MSSRRSCKNDPDIFCYVCGKFTLRQHRKSISEFVVKAYFAYFGIKLGDQDKRWAPHIICSVCYSNLHGWICGRRSLPFGIPMIWREATNHTNDCYFCLIKNQGFTARNKSKIIYPIINSAVLPVPHSDDLPIPVFSSLPQDEVLSQACHSVNKTCETTNRDLSETESQTTESEEDDDNQDLDFSLPSCSNETTNKTPDTFNQGELNDLVRDLCLSKESTELLASRLAEKYLLSKGRNISYYRDRDREFRQFFSSAESFVYCNDVPNLLLLLGIDSYNPTEWRLFIDSSKRSLKCVLLHNGNEYASIPLAHSVHTKEGYDEVKEVLDLIKYKEHNWIICVDLKMVNFLLGQQSGYTKFPCFICLWDGRARDKLGDRKIGQSKSN